MVMIEILYEDFLLLVDIIDMLGQMVFLGLVYVPCIIAC